MYIGLHVKYRFFLSDFNDTWIFWTVFFFEKIPEYQILMEICLVEAEFYADRRTDRHEEANSRFSQICEKRLINFVHIY